MLQQSFFFFFLMAPKRVYEAWKGSNVMFLPLFFSSVFFFCLLFLNIAFNVWCVKWVCAWFVLVSWVNYGFFFLKGLVVLCFEFLVLVLLLILEGWKFELGSVVPEFRRWVCEVGVRLCALRIVTLNEQFDFFFFSFELV